MESSVGTGITETALVIVSVPVVILLGFGLKWFTKLIKEGKDEGYSTLKTALDDKDIHIQYLQKENAQLLNKLLEMKEKIEVLEKQVDSLTKKVETLEKNK